MTNRGLTATLPILPLPYPYILLPSARITLALTRSLGETLVDLIQESDNQPVLAAVPLITVLPEADSDNANNDRHADDQNDDVVGKKGEPLLCEYGTAARIVRLIRPSARNARQPYLLTLLGLTRIHLPTPSAPPTSPASLVFSPVKYLAPSLVPPPKVIQGFKVAAIRVLDRLAKDTTQPAKRDVWLKLAGMIEDCEEEKAVSLADVVVATMNGIEYRDKLEYLCTSDPTSLLTRATQLFIKQTSISEVSSKIASAVDESLSKQQKEYFLRQQLQAIQRELQALQRRGGDNGLSGDRAEDSSAQSDPDPDLDIDPGAAEESDLTQIKRALSRLERDSEARKTGVREWRRLKRIPQGSVEWGVVRSYLEWLTALPWPVQNPSADGTVSDALDVLRSPTFLKKAKEQLDADHYGLDKVKRRLVEYLTVVRLKALIESEEREKEEKVLVKAEKEGEGKDESKALVKYEGGKAEEAAKVEEIRDSRTDVGVGPSELPSPKPVWKRKKGVKGPILLFVGPPGVGKTSLGQSIARALGRPFQRISLGGVHDEAEIRGHRRTYVASGPGTIVQALRKAGRADCVMLLDEVDKVGQTNFHGDPAAALLEVLDPEQNHAFNDHYINVPLDLSEVLFICTANTLDTISPPLLDRCEIIQLSGYTYNEKMHIARRFLLPKQLEANGLTSSHLAIEDPALLKIISGYTREAGVRSLERAVGSVVRFKAVEWAEHLDKVKGNGSPSAVTGAGQGQKQYNNVVAEDQLEAILGPARWDGDEKEREERRGIVYGLVVTGQGEGGILPVETISVPGSGKLRLTGSLGEVIKESGEIALSWVKTHAYDLCITNTKAQDPLKVPHSIDIHLHLPAGAQKKDGPSAGIAMTCAFISLLTGACIPANVAMTGEITLRGRVTPVGGIKEKVLGAHRAQITKVILPWPNRKDVEHDVPLEIRNAMQFVFVRTVEEALEAAFGKGTLGWRRNSLLMESRL